MSNYPTALDDDVTLPVINDNLSEIGGDAINSLRDAVFNIEQYVGTNSFGVSIESRLGLIVSQNGTINSSVITSLGLVTLPITNNQIIDNAGIPESKLHLDYRTQDLFNYIRDLSRDVNQALGWISISGVKLEPHLIGAIYRHDLSQIDVAEISTEFLNNKFRVNRDNTNSYTLINDMNNELLAHQWADGSPFGVIQNVITNDGSIYPSNYAHVASGIFLDSSRFAIIPQTVEDVQAFADFIDNASILTLGTRIQNLYNNGISRNSRSSSLTTDGYGQPLVPVTPAVAYLRGTGNLSTPFDNIDTGDDIIQFMPSSTVTSNNTFDEQFALVNPGDIVRINYAGDGYNVEVAFVISEKKYIESGGNKIYIVRVAGKNIAYSPNAMARIDRCLFNNNKYGVLATAAVSMSNSPGVQLSATPSLIIANPRGAQTLGIDFSPDEFNETHYLLYLALYPDGNPTDGYVFLPGIDVTGNGGTTPGAYTLDSIVAATNNAFRQPGFNYRFIAFSYQGEFGVMLADSYSNVSFSIISGVVDGSGNYNQASTNSSFPNNVVDIFPGVDSPSAGIAASDPLGFGPSGSNIASPPFLTSYPSAIASQIPTKLLVPLRRNNYYVNGNEREILNLDVEQVLDQYGDGYWVGTIDGYTINPGPPGHVLVTYLIPLDLSASQLKAGKTLVIQPTNLLGSAGVNYGRFIISSVTFSCCPPVQTQITVYDGVHATGASPAPIAAVGTTVAIYFNSDSASFNNETATDFTTVGSTFKRYLETYVDGVGDTFTHERGRFSLLGANVSVNGSILYSNSSSLTNMNLVTISPKLMGYQFGFITKITLNITNYNSISGIFTGYLSSYDGSIFTRLGPTISGKIGEIIRFYDETNIDYIDVTFNVNSSFSSFTNQYIDIQLFPTLALDEEIMLISTCQVNTSTNVVDQVIDRRQFGNTSEEEFTTSAINFISFPEKALHFNGIIRGFDISNITNEFISLTGGLVLSNGVFNSINDQVVTIPKIVEVFTSLHYNINYALCANSIGELIAIPLTDFDPIAGTPNAPNRVMTVLNVVSNTTYNVDSNIFSYILNNRKDLTILYIISATVTGSGSGATVSLSSRDVRRFVNDSDSNIPAVLTSDTSQGNFKTLASALNWLKFNSSFQNNLQVKGNFTINTDPGLNFPLNIVGQGATASLTFSSAMNISNVTFSNITVTFSSTLLANNVIFDNCVITFGASSILTNVVIDPSTVNVLGLLNVAQTSIANSVINVPVVEGFAIASADVSFNNCIFNYTANPVGTGSYSTADLANVSLGLIYASVSSTINNLSINECIFNNTLPDHYPFISIQLTAYSSVAQDIEISNNQFVSSASVNDIRAVVAFTSTLTAPAGGSVYPKFPKLVNVVIENNLCNYDQMILVSTIRSGPIVGSMLAATNCRIVGNTCGTIGFITAGDIPSHPPNSTPASGGLVRNKEDQLIIEKNTCLLITNLDYQGKWIAFSDGTTDWVKVGTGAYTIDTNYTHWIVVGASTWTIPGEGGIIINNRLAPFDPGYLSNFTDTSFSTLTPSNIAIQLLSESQGADGYAGNAQSIISSNIIIQKPLLETSGAVVTTFYYNTAIDCFNNAQIINNIINSVINNVLNPIMNIHEIGTMMVSENTLTRGALNNIVAYITGPNTSHTPDNVVHITGNVFDSQFIDTANTNNATGVNISSNWVFYANANQTSSIAISLADFGRGLNIGGFRSTTPTGPALPITNVIVDPTSTIFVERLLDATNSFGANYTTIGELTTSAGKRIVSMSCPLDYILPPGVQVVSANIGAYLQAADGGALDTTSTSNNQITLSLVSYNYNLSTFPPNGILNVKENVSFSSPSTGVDNSMLSEQGFTLIVGSSSSSGSTYNIVTQAAILGDTQYCPVIVSNSSVFATANSSAGIPNGGYKIGIEFTINYDRVVGGLVYWYFSPILIQFVWM